VPRFVELYVPKISMHSGTVENLKLVVIDASGDLDWDNAIELKDKPISSTGFITLCNQAGKLEYGQKCTAEVSKLIPGAPTNIDGCYTLAVVHGDTNRYEVVDMYGVLGEPCEDTVHDFTDGQAVRLNNSTLPNPIWDQYNWEVSTPKDEVNIAPPGSWNPWNDTPLKIFITELADPEDTTIKSFVELYSPNKAGKDVKEELLLVKFDENSDPPISFQCLKGLQFNDEGFIVFCRDKLEWDTTECQYQSDIAELGGTEDVAIVRGSCSDAPEYTTIVDIFGVPGEGVEGKQVFTLGRAVRKTDADEAKSIFDINDWIISPGQNGIHVVSTDCDPGKWTTETAPTNPPTTVDDQVVESSAVAGDGPNPTSPSQTPPTIVPATGKGKGGKGAPKTRIRLLHKRL
jgi:hypothetical protein